MLQARDKIDQEIWWKPRGGHARYEDVHRIMEHDGWNMNVMTELLNKEVCDHVVNVMKTIKEEEPTGHYEHMGKGYSVKNIFSVMEDSVDCVTNVKPLIIALPIFIIWNFLKRRNITKYGGRMSKNIFQFLESYTPIISCKVVRWVCTHARITSAILMALISTRFNTVLRPFVAEVKTFKDSFNHCVQNDLLPLVMEKIH
ncbi:hypothetical protein H5410_001843 [Solanum commersonii]|uniref:Uncharacterized protein n=1 Tax=Solanum commersonii TaxID=4109 RepID=A0A9J6B065_SOLCO|nr:hypothetical protein H5410_001843 [Solanum commersonii]